MASMAIDGTYNVRGVGDSSAPWLVRSATLDAITDAGASALAGLGVALVVDLREDAERGAVRHGIPVLNVPIFRAPDGPPLTGTLEDVYATLIGARGRELTSAVAAIADSAGPVLVHCAAGKDRTGLVVALTLLAAGVPEDDVVDDYTLSATEVRLFHRELAEIALRALPLTEEEHASALRLHLDSPAVALRHALRGLESVGGAEAYLLRHGLTVEQFHALRDRFADGHPDTRPLD